MTAHITIIGTVATDPKLIHFDNGGSKCTFRVAESERRYDRNAGVWVETDTNWYTVNSSRALALNAADSIVKGQRVIATGKVRVRNWHNPDGRSGTVTEIDVEGLGPDLRFGTARYEKQQKAAAATGDSGAADSGADSADSAHSVWAVETGGASSGEWRVQHDTLQEQHDSQNRADKAKTQSAELVSA